MIAEKIIARLPLWCAAGGSDSPAESRLTDDGPFKLDSFKSSMAKSTSLVVALAALALLAVCTSAAGGVSSYARSLTGYWAALHRRVKRQLQ